ncbi:PIG-L deacetylase family protein [Terriglobus sp. RCC_193]|uniref:PIG-L deacetylase family protein n=1 Tax=Terriglobus sp. RCC_193 TaxID=3239218 RepID=UPI003524BB26
MPKRLMCVIAHPDDECFAFGGALALAADAGWETYVICLTDGQAATNRGVSHDGSDLGRMRREEFARSCAVLGVTKHELLDYQDGKLETVPLMDAAKRLVERMRIWKPNVVLTFGLDGSLNVHADHTAVCAFTSAAFHWSARSKRFPGLGLEPWVAQRLYHQSTDFTLPDREPQQPAPWTVELDVSAVKQRKYEAFEQHTSQLPVLEKVRPFWEKHGHREFYTLAAANDPQAATITHSLIEGTE